jgi:hypothetical protein
VIFIEVCLCLFGVIHNTVICELENANNVYKIHANNVYKIHAKMKFHYMLYIFSKHVQQAFRYTHLESLIYSIRTDRRAILYQNPLEQGIHLLPYEVRSLLVFCST